MSGSRFLPRGQGGVGGGGALADRRSCWLRPRRALPEAPASITWQELLLGGLLPEDPLVHPGLEAFEIPGDDPRLPLRGQQGVRLRAGARPLGAGTFCGFYG